MATVDVDAAYLAALERLAEAATTYVTDSSPEGHSLRRILQETRAAQKVVRRPARQAMQPFIDLLDALIAVDAARPPAPTPLPPTDPVARLEYAEAALFGRPKETPDAESR